MSMSSILSVRELNWSVRGRKLLEDIRLELESGETVGIIGPNGAGKSTLLKLLARLLTADSGHCSLLGSPYPQWSATDFAQRVAYQEQRLQFAWSLPVREIVALGRLPWRKLAGQVSDRDDDIIAAALAECGITALAERPIDSLSAGEQALVGLARVIAGEPALILADEPAAALDPHYQLLLMETLRHHALGSPPCANLIVLHDLNLAARFCKRLLLLHEGRVVVTGTPETVLTRETLARYYRVEAAIMATPHGLQVAALERLGKDSAAPTQTTGRFP